MSADRWLCIDPGLASTGWTVAERGLVLAVGTITINRGGELERYLREVRSVLCGEIAEWNPTRLAIERSPVKSRAGSSVDFFGVGISAGVWAAMARSVLSIPEPLLVPVREWRDAIIGKRREWRGLHRDVKTAAKLAALRVAEPAWMSQRTHGAGELSGPRRQDAAESTCLALYLTGGTHGR